MADVTLDLKTTDSKELYGQGVRAFVLQDYDTAVNAFSTVSEKLVAEHGTDTHDSLGDVYLYYGKALLEVSRRECGPFGEGVLKDVEEEGEEVEEDEETEEKTDDSNTKTEEANDKTEEESDKIEEGENKDEEAGLSEATENQDAEDDLTDLQLAWEVLELAKRIFTERGDNGKKNLADTLIVLGEISLESGNFTAAIEDMKQGLELQKSLFGSDSRTIAETFYKLGGAYATNAQIEEAVQCFNSSLEYIENKIGSLKKDEEHQDANKEEIEELTNLVPEIQEKIVDMKNLKAEIAKKMTASNNEAEAKVNGNSETAGSSKQINDISHLVKRKRKDDDVPEEVPAKKQSP